MHAQTYSPSVAERDFLIDLQTRCYRFFSEEADSQTGFIPDRAGLNGESRSDFSSSASCGFGLASHAIAASAKWGDYAAAEQRAEQLLTALLNVAEHERGFLFHFIDNSTGRRAAGSEVSSIDTAIMLAGAMVAAQTFGPPSRVANLANQLCDRVDWRWMLDGSDQFRMGWKPESGFLPYRWDRFSELTLMVLIAIGARENAVAAECWSAWKRVDTLHFQGQPFLSYPPLFVHQYPQAFFDFRNVVSPSGRSYWQNSILAHHAQIEFMTRLAKVDSARFSHYGPLLWGLTSSDSVDGYRDWGGPWRDNETKPERGIDGTVVPSAAGGGLAIVPAAALRTLNHQRSQFGDAVYGRYGFVNAYNPATGWNCNDVIGIDTGVTLLMAENLLNGAVWSRFMEHEIAVNGLARAGFVTANEQQST